MRTCPRCGRGYPEVRGAPEQACPHCGHVERPTTPEAPAAERGARVDPVAAAGAAFRLWARHPLAILGLWTPAFVAYLVEYLALAAYVRANPIPDDPALIDTPTALGYLGVALPLILLAWCVEMASWTFVAAWARRRLAPEDEAAAARPKVATAALGGLALGPTFVVSPALLFVPVHWLLFAPAAMAEGRGVAQAFDASRRFAKRRRTYGLTALSILAWLLVLALVYLLSFGTGQALAATGIPADFAEALATALLLWGFAPLVPLLPAAYWALAARAGTEPAAPEPAARASTKCPRCGALIPYAATGSPVDVKCPSCGARGRVL